MNILYINHYAGGPVYGMEYRCYYLAREWVRAGHQVTIVAASQSHVRSKQPVMTGRFTREAVDGVSFVWCETPAYQGNGVGRVLNIVAFLRRLGQWRQWLDAKPDVVVASSTYPADIGAAGRIARRHGATLVWEVHDLWPLSPIELGGMSRRHPFIIWMQRAENAACRDADVVVSMLPKADAHLCEHGMAAEKFVYVPNGITLEEWEGSTEMPVGELGVHLAAERAKGRTIVGYAGSHGVPNALDVLLDAAAQVRREPFVFVLVGDGMEKASLARRIAAEGLDNVRLFAPIPKRQVPGFLAAVDIAYIGWQRVPIYRFGIGANKLMDYMMARCVVLHSVEAGNDPVGEAGCGYTVAPESASSVVDGLRRLACWSIDDRRAAGARGREYVLANHTYPVLAQRFLDAVSGKMART